MNSDYNIEGIKSFLDEENGNYVIDCIDRQQEIADIVFDLGLNMGDWYGDGEADQYRYMYYASDVDEMHMLSLNYKDRHTVTIEELLCMFHKEDEGEDEEIDLDFSILFG